ncbi:MAG: ABC transporter ATP-binding protein [Verrucomicrobiota bacterium]|nr:ABC transporter ATP-binding protein [Verrucomicrobiota bacterium]
MMPETNSSSTPYAIEVHNLGKRYRRRHQMDQTLKSTLIDRLLRRSRTDEFWALRDLTFAIRKGTTCGIIGRNGSGKSTLLGVLARTITPTEGTIEVHGKVATLLELGAGFHPDLTGRENIFLNAAILGMNREQIAERFDRIVAFAGLEDFIDTPVKHYSSGMYVRLGFSVAVEVEPDILLVDEVLAVGDESFQRKCLEKIKEFQAMGRTIVIVSHALETVERLCDEVILLEQGAKVAAGGAGEIVAEYLRRTLGRDQVLWVEEYGDRSVEITEVRLYGPDHRRTAEWAGGKPAAIEIDYTAHLPIDNPVFGFMIKREDDRIVFGSNTQIMGYSVGHIEGTGSIRVDLRPLTLLEGKFYLSLAVHSEDHKTQFHRQESWYAFNVVNATEHHGQVLIPCTWSDGGQPSNEVPT